MKHISADIIIVGGGAAGLMAAAGAAGHCSSKGMDAKIIVLEKMGRPGRKIMITGKGRCNFTNLKNWNEFSEHIHPKPGFLKSAFYNLTSEKMIDFLTEQGMESVVERGDRAFPASHLASDVVDALLRAAEGAGAEVLCGKEVDKVSRTGQAGVDDFQVNCTDGSCYVCSKLIICTGGLSYPKTGSTGDGFSWAKYMGHSLRPLFPSLTAIVPSGYKDITISGKGSEVGKGHIDRSTPLSETGNMLCGNQLKNVGLSIIIDGNTAAEEFGDLDFTDGGLEGPIGFKVSRKCVNALMNGSRVQAIIDMKPAVEIEDLQARIAALWNEIAKDKRSANKLYKDRFKILLTKVLPMQLIPGFVKMNPNADHKSLAKALKGWKMDMEGYVGYERCVVTAGGVSQDEMTPKTLESRLVPGLYFAGEILDLDGDTGGYNLQIAFSTGYLAGSSAAKTLTSK
ncbi:MAG: aminoacetone oxidase family FAD-binding enzyme [Bacteroidales bacterium]|nr:aminoacetone oxidase family FAD-binding enzyme [Bacteroidales bacterium]